MSLVVPFSMRNSWAVRSRAVTLAVIVCSVVVSPAASQTFSRVVDPAIDAFIQSCSSASWIDADDDGDLDLFVTTWSAATPNVLFRNDGGGGFIRDASFGLETVTAETFGSGWADVDGDGRPEPFVSQLFAGGGVLLQSTGATFVPRPDAVVTGATVKGQGAWGDFDADGDPDLVLACLLGTGGITTANRLFVNDGGFVFTERDTATLATVMDTHHTATWCDFDDDGDVDLAFATGGVGSSKRDRVWRNMRVESGTAFFTPLVGDPLVTDLHDSQLITWADVDNDGDRDAYVLNYTTYPNMLYRNDGGGFTKRTGIGPIVTDAGFAHGAAWGDYDNDGDLDVYVARDGGQANRFYRNAGDGTFTSVTTGEFVTLGRSNWSAVTGDYDRDGDLDLFAPVRDANGPGLLYRNDLATGAHWAEIHAVSATGRFPVLGAKLRVRATIGGTPRWQVREVSASTGYGGHDMLDAHFGLGDAAWIDTLIAQWPGGERDTVVNLPVDRVLTLTQSLGVVDVAAPAGTPQATGLTLDALSPNPTRGAVRLSLALANPGPVRIDLHDVRGRHVQTLFAGRLKAGRHALPGTIPAGLPAGAYFVRAMAPGHATAVKRLAVLR